MDYGVAFIPSMDAAQVVDLAVRAEVLGYEYLFLPDQTFHRDPFPLLALCAQATRTIRLGLAVTTPYTRHPVQIARAAGLLGEVSQGRFILGLGAGNRTRLLGALGMDPSGIHGRLRESVRVIRALLHGETVEYASPTLVLKGVHLDFRPPHPVPLYLATRGPRILALAGEVADGVIMESLFSPEGMAWALHHIAEGLERAGRALRDITTVAWQALVLSDDAATAADERFRHWAGMIMSTTDRELLRRLGIDDDIVRAVAEDLVVYGERGVGRRISAAEVQKLLLVGAPEDVAQQVRMVRDRGTSILASLIQGSYHDILSAMERFAGEVRPLLEG